MTDGLTVVTGAGGFIGGHLVADLRRGGAAKVRAVDLKPVSDWYQAFPNIENLMLDLRDLDACRKTVGGADATFNLAADMGGMGFIELNRGALAATYDWIEGELQADRARGRRSRAAVAA